MAKREQLMHATTWRSSDKKSEAIVCAIKDIDSGDTRLEIVRDPLRTIGVTRIPLREGINVKKLCEHENNLDTRVIKNCELATNLKEMLYGTRTYGYKSLRNMINSPFTYGADIDMPVLIKQHYYNKHKVMCSKYRVGSLDIEVDVVGAKLYASSSPRKTIIIVNYTTPELKTYSAVLKGFVKGHTHEEILNEINSSYKKFRLGVNEGARALLDEHDPEFNLKLFDNELDLLIWIFKRIHESNPDYVSIWNMDYDIPRILDRIRDLGGNIWNIIPNPEVPSSLRRCNYRKDNNPNLPHFTHAWHYFECSGNTLYYDSMCLYSRLRKHKGMEDSYTLDAIAKKHLGDGKRELEEAGHYEMQTLRPVEYCGYGAMDTVICTLLDKVVDDVVSMNALIPYSDVSCFAQQTIQLKHRFYDYCKQRGMMSSSQMGKILQPTDDLIVNVGGNVLPPALAWRTGVNRIKELIGFCRRLASKMMLLVSDLDVTLNYKVLACCSGNTAPSKY